VGRLGIIADMPMTKTRAVALAACLALACLVPACRDLRIRSTFGDQCHLVAECGDLLAVDCNSAADGPLYYVNSSSLEKVSTCGGACMKRNCTDCPPKEWTCAQK
jgi:hypothetical protein